MAFILEFNAFRPARPHRLCGSDAFQSLHSGLLIGRDKPYALGMKLSCPFVKVADVPDVLLKFLLVVNLWVEPVFTAVGFQVGRIQKPFDVPLGYACNALFMNLVREFSGGPMSDWPIKLRWLPHRNGNDLRILLRSVNRRSPIAGEIGKHRTRQSLLYQRRACMAGAGKCLGNVVSPTLAGLERPPMPGPDGVATTFESIAGRGEVDLPAVLMKDNLKSFHLPLSG